MEAATSSEAPWRAEELEEIADQASRRLGMSREKALIAYHQGKLPDTPAAFDFAMAADLLGDLAVR